LCSNNQDIMVNMQFILTTSIYNICVCKLPLHTSHTYFKLQDCMLLVFLEHFVIWEFSSSGIWWCVISQKNKILSYTITTWKLAFVTGPSTYKLSFHFKLQYFKFAQFMVLDSCTSKTKYFWQPFLLLSMLVEVTTRTWSAAVKMLVQYEILLCLTLKVDKCAARLLLSYSNGRQFSTNEKYERL